MFTRQIRKQVAKNIERVSERKNKFSRLASGFVILLANSEFYSHLMSWQVTDVINMPYVTDACIAGRPVRFGLLSRGIAISRDMLAISRE
jgi:hypothetical protein